MCKELAKELRSQLKEIGYNRNMVSVTSDYNSINVAVKSLEVDFKKVEELANNYEKIDRDYATGEILNGCNTYVNVKYSQDLINTIKKNYKEKAEEIFKITTERNSLECVFSNDNFRVLYSSELHQLMLQQYEEEQNWFNTIERHCAYNIYDIIEGLTYFFMHYKFDAETITEVPAVEKVEEPQQQNINEVSNTQEKTQTTTNNDSIEFTVNEDIHTKTGKKIFVAKLKRTLSKAEYINVSIRIKPLGGYYSSFKKGFIFDNNPTELLQKEFNTTIEQSQEIEATEPTKQPEIIINESLAKRAKENMSFSDYKEGSATQEYNRVIENMAQKINEAKEQLKDDSEKQSQLEYLLTEFKKDYANWINKKNANGASHVSWMISGRGNYNMNKHNKYVAKEDKLWQEYNNIMDIDSKIDKIINSNKIIRADDKNALEKLRAKLEKEQKAHDEMANYNKQARKEKKEVYPAYMLSNSNQRIKNIKDRISQLEKLEELKETKGNTEIEINGIKIIDNLEANRVQMIFPDKPSEEIRKMLKSNGFRWSPSYGAWQRNRGRLSAEKAKSIAESLKEDINKIAM